MNLIDRYVAEIGRNLPEKNRADIEKEIHSTLEDMLEEKSRQAGRPVDEDMTVEALKEFGHPLKVAASYQPERHLIGPQLYPYLMMVIRISLLVIFGVALIRLGVNLFQGGDVQHIVRSVLEGIFGFFGTAINMLGIVVLVFAVLEWAMPNVDERYADFDPRSLPEPEAASEPDKFTTGRMITKIIFTVAAVILFNAYPQLIGIWFPRDGQWASFPILSAAFFHYLPWLNIFWMLEIAHSLLLLREGRWQTSTRWYAILLAVFRISLTYAMLNGPSIVGVSAANLQSLGIQAPEAGALVAVIGAAVSLGLIVAIVAETIQVFVALYRMYFKDRKFNLLSIG